MLICVILFSRESFFLNKSHGRRTAARYGLTRHRHRRRRRVEPHRCRQSHVILLRHRYLPWHQSDRHVGATEAIGAVMMVAAITTESIEMKRAVGRIAALCAAIVAMAAGRPRSARRHTKSSVGIVVVIFKHHTRYQRNCQHHIDQQSNDQSFHHRAQRYEINPLSTIVSSKMPKSGIGIKSA